MKRILSLILCVLMLVPCLAVIVSAEGEISDEYKNFALDDGIGSYASSMWNADSDPKYINNEVLEDSYRFWRPQGVDRNPALDDRVQYCGLRSTNKYYEVKEVVIYHGINGPDNNIKYTIKALVLGEWVEIGSAYDQETTPWPESVEGVGILKIDVTDVVTREIRLECSEWGRWSSANSHLPKDPYLDDITTPDIDESKFPKDNPDTPQWDESKLPTAFHDWWKVPLIHELQTWGTEAPPPPWDVPFGAVLSTNACLGGMAAASSTNVTANIYPALATDDNIRPTTTTLTPYWQAGTKGAGQWIESIFDRYYDIVNVSVNFGGSVDEVEMTYDVYLILDDEGTMEPLVTGQKATSSLAGQDNIVFPLAEKKNVKGVRIVFTEVSGGTRTNRNLAVLTEMGAEIDADYKVYDASRDEMVEANKCVFLRDYMTANRKQSTAIGNLAIFGSAYASSVMTYANIASVEYINDGGIARNEDLSWFASTFEKGTYCGVVLQREFDVDKVVLYFNDPITGDVNGTNVMEVDIQVKVNGEYKTVRSGVTSYDAKKREYVVSVQFDEPVKTDDVRIVYQSNGMVFPYIKELEVFSSAEMYGAYYGHQIGLRTNKGKEANALEDFAARTLIPRSTYLDKISPIQYFEVTKNFDIKVLAWI